MTPQPVHAGSDDRVYRRRLSKPTEHRIRLNQVTKWAERKAKKGLPGLSNGRQCEYCSGKGVAVQSYDPHVNAAPLAFRATPALLRKD
ncbi:MAG: hypothetical protein WB992_24280 [Bryobacteraceae bacterium]